MKRTIATPAGAPKLSMASDLVLETASMNKPRQWTNSTASTQASWTRYIDSRLKHFGAAAR